MLIQLGWDNLSMASYWFVDWNVSYENQSVVLVMCGKDSALLKCDTL